MLLKKSAGGRHYLNLKTHIHVHRDAHAICPSPFVSSNALQHGSLQIAHLIFAFTRLSQVLTKMRAWSDFPASAQTKMPSQRNFIHHFCSLSLSFLSFPFLSPLWLSFASFPVSCVTLRKLCFLLQLRHDVTQYHINLSPAVMSLRLHVKINLWQII